MKKQPAQEAEILPPENTPPSDPSKPSAWATLGRWMLGAAADVAQGMLERSRVEVQVKRCPRCGAPMLAGQVHERRAAPGSPPLLDVAPHVCADLRPPKAPKAPKAGSHGSKKG